MYATAFETSRDDLLTRDPELQEIHNEVNPSTKRVDVKPQTRSRRLWLVIVTLFTWWIPEILLKHVGRMNRPDVRQAWREKVTLFALIMILCGCVVFYIIVLGKLACPDFDVVWNAKEVSSHTGDDDFYVALRGKVYDISSFWRIQHSDGVIRTTPDVMKAFAGQDLSDYFPPPLQQACPALVVDDTWLLQNTTVSDPTALHYSTQPKCLNVGSTNSALCATNWYLDRFLPKMKKFVKGDLVVTRNKVLAGAQSGERQWAIIDGRVYDLTNYFYTSALLNPTHAAIKPNYYFLDDFVEGLFQGSAGRDVTKEFNNLANWNASARAANLQCLQNAFYYGKVDFRQSAKCQANNYILLSFTVILCTVIVVKFLASLQFGGGRPARQNRLVICQIPTYTEGEDQLRNAIDSVSDLDYPDELKLLFIVCDGILVGQGNKKPTCEIVLDILGVDQAKIDPPALAYESVSEGTKVYNRAKTYAGLYEHEGHVVPYLVLVKVGNEKETHRPGNRGKRDSQIMLMRFLNRFHEEKPMTPFEIEMAYQMSQVIGVSPGLYEYVLMLDADTKLAPDSLNVLISAFQADAKLMGTCGETALAKKELSWWTMIQVYEYYNSHALSKAFESLFGNVTCLPGCFCIYRIKSARGLPLLISDEVVDGYSDSDISTLHKKNLLTLGEDRYLTTLMTKHNTSMRLTFCPQAKAYTAAPETWSILVSQRRRWINSTIHNLFELLFIDDMCGFCCFSMRFVVIIDLFGTLILPATTAYLVYLIYSASSGKSAFPLIAIVMLGAVYGLQALVFLLHRQWEHIGWMVIWIISYPVYSLILPLYSFWHQDDFSWGNTRVVIGEKGQQITYGTEEEEELQPGVITMQRWSEYAANAGLEVEPGATRMTTTMDSHSDVELQDYKQKSLVASAYSIGGLTEQQRKQELRQAVFTVLWGCDLDHTTTRDIERLVKGQVGNNLTALDMEYIDEAVDEHLLSFNKHDVV
ncbi:chitin synthase-domain-containing protein [Protomyces lactucae-debilis]|uniref:chitin synthase n=1 Tax=Protomyces lactucae-debilis TaxID=2754530 RepID=A0A1Y2EW31_PROLT|nr:chitin synthase-domain-containing protein [Protomyces lactucae-debilis]ORY75768.1 chitin synthase-domain-containing protein [Protomyces lactucae-debilis]